MKRTPRFYWLIGVGIILLLAVGLSILDVIKQPSIEEVETNQLVDSKMAIIDKNATARSVIKNMLIDESTKVTVISGTALALSDYILAYSNDKKYRGYMDLTNLTPAVEGSYVLWSMSPSGEYKRMRVLPPKSEFLQYDIPPKDYIMLLSLESAGAGDQPDLDHIVAIEQIEE